MEPLPTPAHRPGSPSCPAGSVSDGSTPSSPGAPSASRPVEALTLTLASLSKGRCSPAWEPGPQEITRPQRLKRCPLEAENNGFIFGSSVPARGTWTALGLPSAAPGHPAPGAGSMLSTFHPRFCSHYCLAQESLPAVPCHCTPASTGWGWVLLRGS